MAKLQDVITKAKYDKQYRIQNKTKTQKRMMQYYLDNKEKRLAYQKEYHANNVEYRKQHRKQYNKDNKEKILKKQLQYEANKYKNNLKYNFTRKITTAIGHSIRKYKNGRRWENLVGYTLNDLIERLKQTMPKGFIWNDYLKGKLHIDHIVPIKAFVFNKPEDQEFRQCWSLCNLRLLSALENRKKNINFDNPILLSLLIKEMI